MSRTLASREAQIAAGEAEEGECELVQPAVRGA
jgi:hypothetical protein